MLPIVWSVNAENESGKVPGTREIVAHPNYIIIYQVSENTVDVLRVLHSRQQFP